MFVFFFPVFLLFACFFAALYLYFYRPSCTLQENNFQTRTTPTNANARTNDRNTCIKTKEKAFVANKARNTMQSITNVVLNHVRKKDHIDTQQHRNVCVTQPVIDLIISKECVPNVTLKVALKFGTFPKVLK
jgi:hypothetical protein